jgi:hypothetical protein
MLCLRTKRQFVSHWILIDVDNASKHVDLTRSMENQLLYVVERADGGSALGGLWGTGSVSG